MSTLANYQIAAVVSSHFEASAAHRSLSSYFESARASRSQKPQVMLSQDDFATGARAPAFLETANDWAQLASAYDSVEAGLLAAGAEASSRSASSAASASFDAALASLNAPAGQLSSAATPASTAAAAPARALEQLQATFNARLSADGWGGWAPSQLRELGADQTALPWSHPRRSSFAFVVDDREVHVALDRNDKLFSEDYKEVELAYVDGKRRRDLERPAKTLADIPMCWYHGQLAGLAPAPIPSHLAPVPGAAAAPGSNGPALASVGDVDALTRHNEAAAARAIAAARADTRRNQQHLQSEGSGEAELASTSPRALGRNTHYAPAVALPSSLLAAMGRAGAAASLASSGGDVAVSENTQRYVAPLSSNTAAAAGPIAIDTCYGGFAGFFTVGDVRYGLTPALNVLSQRDIARSMATLGAAASRVALGSLHVVYRIDRDSLHSASNSLGLTDMAKSACGVGHESHDGHAHAHAGTHALNPQGNTHSHAHTSPSSAGRPRAKPLSAAAQAKVKQWAADAAATAAAVTGAADNGLELAALEALRAAEAASAAASAAAAAAASDAAVRVMDDISSPALFLAPSSSLSTSSLTSEGMSLTSTPSQIYIKLYLATDFQRHQARGSNSQTNAATLANIAAALYNQTNFNSHATLLLVAQSVFSFGDPYSTSVGTCGPCSSTEVSVDDLLSNWNSWRSTSSDAPTHEVGHLLSGFNFQSSVLGYAGVGVMCIKAQSGGIEDTFSSFSDDALNGAVLTHEIGHNFNMAHDGVGNGCPSSGFVMNAIIGATPTQFSTCSMTYYNNYVTSSLTCMLTPPTSIWGTNATCGNGFVEDGEQCDCGAANCAGRDACCNGATCQLVAGATCSTNQACCNPTACQPYTLAANHTCREAVSSCDLPEVCQGTSAACPMDVYKGAGTQCTVSATVSGQPRTFNGACYLGRCASHDNSCLISGASISGGPYVACPSQSALTSGAFCGTQYCARTSNPSSCFFFTISGQTKQIDDGVQCGAGRQCLAGSCVSSSSVASTTRWAASAWNPCSACGEKQTRSVTCTDTAGSATYDNSACPPFATVASERLCQNSTLFCLYEEENEDGTIVFFGRTVDRSVLVYGCVGGFALYLLLVLVCYRVVTKPVDGIKNMYQRDTLSAVGMSSGLAKPGAAGDRRPSMNALALHVANSQQLSTVKMRKGSSGGKGGKVLKMI